MEPHSPTDGTPNASIILESQIRECFGRVVYSHKTHEKCADILSSRLACVKLWQIALSAVTTGGCVAVVFGAGTVAGWISALVSTTLLALNAYTKDYDLGELSGKHRQAGVELWIIRERYLSLITDLRMGNKPIDRLVAERDTLLEDLHGVYSGTPGTTVKAYKKAQKALQELGDMTFSDEEIDDFLPKELRKRAET